MNALEKRLQKLIEAKGARLGRELTPEEISETRSFAADVLEEASPNLANLVDQVEEIGLMNDDGTLDIDTINALAAGEGEEGEEEVSEEEVAQAIANMSEEELVEFLADNFTEEELLEMAAAEEEGQYIPADQGQYQQRAYSADDVVTTADLEAIRAEAREEARLEAQEILDTDRRAFALAQDVNDQSEYVENLIASGQLPPHLAEVTLSALIASVSVPGETRAYAAADLGEYGGASMTRLLHGLLDNLPVQAGFQPLSIHAQAAQGRSFSASDFGALNDPAAAARVDSAVRQRMKDTGETYSTAYDAIQGGI